MFKKILVPIDLSEPQLAKPAIEAAVSMAKDPGTRVRLLNVVPIMPVSVTEYMPPDFETDQVASSTDALRIVAQEAGLKPDQVSIGVRKGGIYHEIIQEAEESKVDLIVMSSHRPAMRTYFLGSNAAHVVRYAKCSVLVVRN